MTEPRTPQTKTARQARIVELGDEGLEDLGGQPAAHGGHDLVQRLLSLHQRQDHLGGGRNEHDFLGHLARVGEAQHLLIAGLGGEQAHRHQPGSLLVGGVWIKGLEWQRFGCGHRAKSRERARYSRAFQP